MAAMADLASRTVWNFTKPNPRDAFVETSRMTQQLSTAPNFSNAAFNAVSSTSSARFLTYTLLCWFCVVCWLVDAPRAF